MPTLGLGFIGAGRVASTLSAAWSASGESIIGAYSRSFDSSTALLARCPPARAFASAQELVSNCDLVFVTVPDSAIEEVVNELTWRAGQFVVHCSAAGERMWHASIWQVAVWQLRPQANCTRSYTVWPRNSK